MSRRDVGAARARAPPRTLTRQARRGFLLFRVNLPRTTTARAYTSLSTSRCRSLPQLVLLHQRLPERPRLPLCRRVRLQVQICSVSCDDNSSRLTQLTLTT